MPRLKPTRHEHRPQIPRRHPDLFGNQKGQLHLYRQNRLGVGDDPHEIRLPQPSPSVRQEPADHHAGLLLQRAKGTFRRTEDHGLGDGVGTVPGLPCGFKRSQDLPICGRVA